MTRSHIALRYTCFAVVATFVNLATQWITFHVYRGVGELVIGIMAGTASGLISKYLLDKFWIFDDRSLQITDNLHKFFLYTVTGALTTSLFWGFETTFALLDDRQSMRYLGALIGLAIGYFVKFHLDKRLVFRGRI
jgi:putative flippase GtrA